MSCTSTLHRAETTAAYLVEASPGWSWKVMMRPAMPYSVSRNMPMQPRSAFPRVRSRHSWESPPSGH
eukprot:7004956-Pyramimonas_sp.AAC.1